MHPVLLTLPLPDVALPVLPALLALSALGAAIALIAWRTQARDMVVVGGALALVTASLAPFYRGQVYVLGDLPIYSYGVMLCLAFVAGWVVSLGLAEREGLPREAVANCFFVTALSALAGARILYLATNPDVVVSVASVFDLRRGGLVAYGGFLGGLLGSVGYLRVARLPLWAWADAASVAVAAGLAITRVGCYLFGCDFGRPLAASAPGWLRAAGTFPRWEAMPGSPAWAQHVNQGRLPLEAQASLPVHPTQLYEALVGAGLCALLWRLHRRRGFSGQVFLSFALAYGSARFLLEFLRDDVERGAFGPAMGAVGWWVLGIAIVALAAQAGPVWSSFAGRARVRALAACIAVCALLLGLGWLAAPNEALQLSTSQWIALASAPLAAGYWRVRARRPSTSYEPVSST